MATKPANLAPAFPAVVLTASCKEQPKPLAPEPLPKPPAPAFPLTAAEPSDAQLQELLEQFDTAVREGIGISREDQRHWQQVWFEAHKSGQWQAEFLRWLRPQDRLGLVHVDALAMDLAAKCPAGSDPGDLLQLRVQAVDPLRDQLRLQATG